MARNFIELFAGCGGLSLGLESVNFELFMANEFSPMAGETFAYNILRENLRQNPYSKTIWLSSNFSPGAVERLSENPFKAKTGQIHNVTDTTQLKGKLIIGDISQLYNKILSCKALTKQLRKAQIDLVSGGPPCQSYSSAGKRERDNERNNLPLAFAEFVSLVNPKLVLLENVTGIMRPFIYNSTRYYAWFEVAIEFAKRGYVPICFHVNAKFFGLPQNRPRFIMIAIEAKRVKILPMDKVLSKSLKFYTEVKRTKGKVNINDCDFKPWDLTDSKNLKEFTESIYLPTPITGSEFRSVKFAIHALLRKKEEFDIENIEYDSYHNLLNDAFPNRGLNGLVVKNHKKRQHSKLIESRFRFYKSIIKINNGQKKLILDSLKKGNIEDLTPSIIKRLIKKIPNISTIEELELFFVQHQTKKNSQKPLIMDKPAPATLTIPDDVCHYQPNHNRTLSIREMARIQSFPDWFEFRSKDTTGGHARRYEVPNYTQVGNAVPPLFAKILGEMMNELLNQMDN